MVIGVIGAGLAGLVAGRELAKYGHEVVVIEKSRGYGGRLATRYTGDDLSVKLDHGASFLAAKNESFKAFLNELESKELIRPWTDTFAFYTTDAFYAAHPSHEREIVYAAPSGMNTIGKYLSRWVDLRLNTKVAGLTMVAPGHNRKRPWIINMADTSVLEVDAIIIATPAIQAAGLLSTAQDETPVRALHMEVSHVQYAPAFTVMLGYGERELVDWKGMYCQDDTIAWISNESSKRDNKELTLVVQATPEFSESHKNAPKEDVEKLLLKRLGVILDKWAENPYWSQTHFWRYHRPLSVLDKPFLENVNNATPMALIGDYFNGNSMESAYVSGMELARHWIAKYPK
jgi:renalase